MFRVLLQAILITAFCGVGDAWATDASVRVGFLVNFSRFIEWSSTRAAPVNAVSICLAPGDDEMMAEMSRLGGQTVQNKPVVAIRVTRPDETSQCNVLYLPVGLSSDPGVWLTAAEHNGTLTVSDRPDFVEEGGMIGLVLSAGHYRFDVNLASAKRADLRMSSNLLRLARSVK